MWHVCTRVADGARNEVNLLRTPVTGLRCYSGIRHYTLDVPTFLIWFGMNGAYQTFKYVLCACSSIDAFLAALLRFRSTSRRCVARQAVTNRDRCTTLLLVRHVLKAHNLLNSRHRDNHSDSEDFACLDDFCLICSSRAVHRPACIG